MSIFFLKHAHTRWNSISNCGRLFGSCWYIIFLLNVFFKDLFIFFFVGIFAFYLIGQYDDRNEVGEEVGWARLGKVREPGLEHGMLEVQQRYMSTSCPRDYQF